MSTLLQSSGLCSHGFNPTQSNSVRLSPTQSNSVRLNPTQSNSVRLSPTQSNSVRPSPTQSDSVRPSPTQSDSVRLSPTQSDSVRLSPTNGELVRLRPFFVTFCHERVKNLFTTAHFAAFWRDRANDIEMPKPLPLQTFSLLGCCEQNRRMVNNPVDKIWYAGNQTML